jgi:hypothetical protein
MKKLAAVALVTATFAAPAHAEADTPGSSRPLVFLREPECAVRLVDLDQYVDALRVELGSADLELERGSGPATWDAPTVVALETSPCDPRSTSVEVVVTDRASGKSARRVVPVWDLEAATRPRAVALATAEVLLHAEWRDSGGAAAAPTPVVVETPSPKAKADEGSSDAVPTPTAGVPAPGPRDRSRDTNTRAPSPALFGSFEYRDFFSEGTPLLGGRVGAKIPLSRSSLELTLDGGAASGSERDPLGTVRVSNATAGVGVAYVARGASSNIAIGPVIEGGYGYVQGEASARAEGSGRSAFVATAALDVGLRLRVSPAFWFTVDVLAGWSVSGLRGLADSRAVAGMSGAEGALRMGALVAP